MDYKNTVISTRIRLARNIKNLPFPNRLNGEEEIYSTLLKGVENSCKNLFKYKMYKMDSIDLYESQALVERHLISKNLQKSKYGYAFINEWEDVSIMVNEEDHLRIQSIVNGFNLESAYNNAAKVEAELKKNLDIAQHPKYGYLTSCPTNLGSAMRASVMVFLPALTMMGMIDNIMLKCQENGITIRGLYGEGTKAEGYMYQVSNQAAIALSEQDILTKIKSIVNQLVEAEEKARANIVKIKGIDLKNSIMISFGILKYACKISSHELMQNLALVKLGVAVGFLNVDVEELNKIIVNTQPAMLCFIAKKQLSAEFRDIERAKTVNKILAKY